MLISLYDEMWRKALPLFYNILELIIFHLRYWSHNLCKLRRTLMKICQAVHCFAWPSYKTKSASKLIIVFETIKIIHTTFWFTPVINVWFICGLKWLSPPAPLPCVPGSYQWLQPRTNYNLAPLLPNVVIITNQTLATHTIVTQSH